MLLTRMSLSGIDVTVRAWLAEAWGRGLAPTDIWKALPFRGVTRREVEKELRALDKSPHADVLATLAFRLNRVDWQQRMRRSFSALDSRTRSIPRRRRVTQREFLEHHYAPQRPVLINGMMKEWKALKKWTPAFFSREFADVPVQVASSRDDTPFYDLNVHAISRQVRFGDYVEWVEGTKKSNAHYLVANNNGLGGPLRALVKDIGFFGGLMNPRLIDGFVYLWYGPGGTVTPLHHDTANILFCQVRGKKRVTLIDPAWTELVRDCVSFYSFIDVEKPDLKRFPYFARIPKLTVTVGPGDALFIPCGWWHFVRGLSTSVSISMTNFTLPNPGSYDDLAPGAE